MLASISGLPDLRRHITGLSYACAVLIPNVEFILGLNGGTSSIVISYIMPGLIYLRAMSTLNDKAVLSRSIL